LLLASQMGETASRALERIEAPAKAKTVTVAERLRGDAGAVLISLPYLGSVSDQRAANGGGDGGRKKAKTNNHKF
jgi:hypothetical protein